MRSIDREALRNALDDEPHLERILDVLLKAVQRTGEPPAVIKIETPDEADALVGLAGGKPISAKSIRTEELERRLRENSRWKCGIRQLLEVRYGKIVSQREARQQKDTGWSEALARLQEVACREAPADLCRRVFHWIETDRAPLRGRYTRQGLPALERDLRAVIGALAQLPEPGDFVLLARLAEEASHDPHAFDAGRSAGSLLDRALMKWFSERLPPGKKGTARWRRRLLLEAGILRDGVSPRVDTFGLLMDTHLPSQPDPLVLDHPWTLRSLTRVRGRPRAAHGVAFVFENPPVFESVLNLLERTGREFDPTLVCTRGRMNTADDLLLDELVEGGAHLFYSGDFDATGLRIALDLRNRHPGRVHLWHFGPDDYRMALRESSRKLRTERLKHARNALPDLVQAMKKEGRVGYQEALTDVLFNDIARFTRTRRAPGVPAIGR